jgi:hypothetical protein
MLAEMEAFLLSPEIFWPITPRSPRGTPPFPRLSLGAYLLVLDELDAQANALTPGETHSLARLRVLVDRVDRKWPVALERKSKQEQRVRFNLWRGYLRDLGEGAETPHRYAYEVRHRVMFARLSRYATPRNGAGSPPDGMRALDRELRARFIPGGFIWDQALMLRYPEGAYWFLYGRPAEREQKPAD